MTNTELTLRREALGLTIKEWAMRVKYSESLLTSFEEVEGALEESQLEGFIDMALELLEIDKGVQDRKPLIEEKLRQIHNYCATSRELLGIK